MHDCLDPDELIAEYRSDAVVARNGNAYRNRYIGVFRFRDGKICALAGVPQPRGDRRCCEPMRRSTATCDPAFAAVRDAFAQNFADGLELGASLSISVDGRNVVDLWGGHLDAARTRPWERDTPRLRVLVHQGRRRDRDDVGGRARARRPRRAGGALLARVRGRGQGRHPGALAAHARGRPARRSATRMPHGSLSDWDAMTTALAAQAPWWEPGTAHGYHGVTFGHLIGEVLRRATGRDVRRARSATSWPRPLGVELLHAAARRAATRAPPTSSSTCRRTARSSTAGTRRPRSGRGRSATRPTATTPRTA